MRFQIPQVNRLETVLRSDTIMLFCHLQDSRTQNTSPMEIVLYVTIEHDIYMIKQNCISESRGAVIVSFGMSLCNYLLPVSCFLSVFFLK